MARRYWLMKTDPDFRVPVTLDAMHGEAPLGKMTLLRKWSRLSVQPVSAEEWKIVVGLGKGT